MMNKSSGRRQTKIAEEHSSFHRDRHPSTRIELVRRIESWQRRDSGEPSCNRDKIRRDRSHNIANICIELQWWAIDYNLWLTNKNGALVPMLNSIEQTVTNDAQMFWAVESSRLRWVLAKFNEQTKHLLTRRAIPSCLIYFIGRLNGNQSTKIVCRQSKPSIDPRHRTKTNLHIESQRELVLRPNSVLDTMNSAFLWPSTKNRSNYSAG